MARHRRMLPSPFVQPVIGRAFAVRADAEQRAECIEGVEPAIEPERELIEVGLQVLRLDAPVMCPLQPRLEVRKHKVDDRQVFFGHGRVIRLDNRQEGHSTGAIRKRVWLVFILVCVWSSQ